MPPKYPSLHVRILQKFIMVFYKIVYKHWTAFSLSTYSATL